MKRKVLSFFVTLLLWQAGLFIAVILASQREHLKVEDPIAIVPYVVIGILPAAVCARYGRLDAYSAALAGAVVGLLPSIALLVSGLLALKGIESWFVVSSFAISNAIAGGLGGFLCSRIQRGHD